jgi:hypothetical protein
MRNPHKAYVVLRRDDPIMVCLSRIGAETAVKSMTAEGGYYYIEEVPCAHALARVERALKEVRT